MYRRQGRSMSRNQYNLEQCNLEQFLGQMLRPEWYKTSWAGRDRTAWRQAQRRGTRDGGGAYLLYLLARGKALDLFLSRTAQARINWTEEGTKDGWPSIIIMLLVTGALSCCLPWLMSSGLKRLKYKSLGYGRHMICQMSCGLVNIGGLLPVGRLWCEIF